MNREDFEKIYPSIESFDKPYSKIVSIHSEPNMLVITEKIDLNHPDCPIVKFEGVN